MKNIKIKDYFSKSLYCESINQTKISGIFIIIATIILCAIYPFAELISYLQYKSATVQILGATESNISLIIIMYIIPFIIAFEGFGFLNKRSACDLYHSMPIKRQAMFVSFALAGTTWLIAAMTLGGLTSIMLFSLVPNIYIPIAGCLNLIVSLIVGGLMIYFACLLAISMSGNKLTQVMLAILIVVIPQITHVVIMNGIDDITNYTQFANFTANIPLLLISSMFGIIANSYLSIFELSTIAFTLVCGVVLAVIACVVFTKRKSELAGNNAPNKFAQHAYRIALMSPFILSYASLIINASSDLITVLLTLFIISIVIYVGYELATTRSSKNMIKSLPLYGVVVGLAIALALVIQLGALIASIPSPSAEKINYVTFQSSQGISTSISDEYTEAFYSHKVYDEEIIQIIADGLDYTIETNGLVETMSKYSDSNIEYTREYVNINTGLFNITRKVIISYEDSLKIEEYFANQTELNSLLIDIPKQEEVLKTALYGVGVYENKIDEDFQEELLEIFLDEFQSLSLAEQYKVLVGDSIEKVVIYDQPIAADTVAVNEDFQFRIIMTTLGKYEANTTSAYIDQTLPKTYAYLLEYSYQSSNENPNYYKDEITTFLGNMDTLGETYFSVTISGMNGVDMYFSTVATEDGALENQSVINALEETAEILLSQETPDYSNLYYFCITAENADSSYTTEGRYIAFELLLSLTDENIEFFQELQRKAVA